MGKTMGMYNDFTRKTRRKKKKEKEVLSINATNLLDPFDIEYTKISVKIQRDLTTKLRGFNFSLDNSFIAKMIRKDRDRFSVSKVVDYGFILTIRVDCTPFIIDGITHDNIIFKIDRYVTNPLTETNFIYSKSYI